MELNEIKQKIERTIGTEVKDSTIFMAEKIINECDESLRDFIREFAYTNYAFTPFIKIYEENNEKKDYFEILEVMKNIHNTKLLTCFTFFVYDQYFFHRANTGYFYDYKIILRFLNAFSKLNISNVEFIKKSFDKYEEPYEGLSEPILLFIIAHTEYLIENPEMSDYFKNEDVDSWDIEGVSSFSDENSLENLEEDENEEEYEDGKTDFYDLETLYDEETPSNDIAYRISFCNEDFEVQEETIYLEECDDICSEFKRVISEFMNKEKKEVMKRKREL